MTQVEHGVPLDGALRRLAGAGSGVREFRVTVGAVTVSVRIAEDNDGDPTWLVLSCRYDRFAGGAGVSAAGALDGARLQAVRPMAVRLTREEGSDAESKRDGLVWEWQSGDEDFDRRVFVNSPTTDEHVLGAVLHAEARVQVLALLSLGFEAIELDNADGEVCARMSASKMAELRGARAHATAADAVQAFAKLASGLPRVAATGGVHPPVPFARETGCLRAIAWAGFLLNVPLLAGVAWCVERLVGRPAVERELSFPMVALGLGLALVGGGVVRGLYVPLVTHAVRGRSDALEVRERASFAAFGAGFVMTLIAAVVFEAAFGSR